MATLLGEVLVFLESDVGERSERDARTFARSSGVVVGGAGEWRGMQFK